MAAKRSIFRPIALDRLSSPEQLDQLMKVTRPTGWLAITGIGLFLVSALLWSVFGKIPFTISGQGIVIRKDGLFEVVGTAAGQVTEIRVAAGDQVTQGQILAVIHRLDLNVSAPPPRITGPGQPAPGKTAPPEGLETITSPFAGSIAELKVNPGDVITPGKSILSLDMRAAPLVGLIYLGPSDGKKVYPGMPIQIEPTTADSEEFGYLLGTVKEVSEYPSSPSAMMTLLENQSLVELFSAQGPPFAVSVELETSQRSRNGYRWSSSRGEQLPLSSGTLCQAKVIVREEAPINLVIPAIKKGLGF